MNDDIRIKIGLPRHRKFRRLRRLVGDRAMEHLVYLFTRVAEERPTGVLTGWDETDIAEAAGWEGDPDDLVAVLLGCGGRMKGRQLPGFLELRDGVYEVHDWAEHQPWIADAPNRSARARRNAKKRWDRPDERQMGLPEGPSEDAGRIAQSNAPLLSSPAPGTSYPPPRAPAREEGGTTPPGEEDGEAAELVALEARADSRRLLGAPVGDLERRIEDVKARRKSQERARGP